MDKTQKRLAFIMIFVLAKITMGIRGLMVKAINKIDVDKMAADVEKAYKEAK